MRHLIDSETRRPIPFPPSGNDETAIMTWLAMVDLILSERGRYDTDTDTLQLIHS